MNFSTKLLPPDSIRRVNTLVSLTKITKMEVYIHSEQKEEDSIRSSMKNLNYTVKVKFHHMLAYQMELAYDPAFLLDYVASSNP